MYIIVLYNEAGTSFICGGTYRINETRYARASHFFAGAKRFKTAARAAAYAERLSKKCCNLSRTDNYDIVEIE